MREKRFLGKKIRSNLSVRLVCLLLLITTGATAATASTPAPPAPEGSAAVPDRKMLEEVVNQALDRQLSPVKEMLAEMSVHKTSLPDILGGIGYILGLFGLWAYFLSKRKQAS